MIKIKKVFILIFILTGNNVFGQVFDTINCYKKYSPKQLHQDLDFLLEKFEKIHPDFFHENPKDTVIARYNNLKSQITKSMTRIDFMNLSSPIVFGIIKDGHNYINEPEADLKQYTEKGGKLFPFPVKIRNGKLFVNSTTVEIPYNSEIIKINGNSSKEIIDKLLSCYNAESDYYEEIMYSDWFNTSYWYSFGGFKEYKVEYKSQKDSNEIIIKSGLTSDEINSLKYNQKTKNYSFYELPEIRTGILEYNACTDLKIFRVFCDTIFNIMKQKKYENLIIDIRNNIGGTTRTNDALFEYITDKPITQFESIETKISKEQKKYFIQTNRFYNGWFKWYHYLIYPIYVRNNSNRKQMLNTKNGKTVKEEFKPEKPQKHPLFFNGSIYLLTSKKTYSAAASLAAAFKCYHVGLIIGQETEERMTFYADWKPVVLPNTKLGYVISSKKYVMACGKDDGRGVIPDYSIDDTKIIYGKDLEMEFAQKMITENKK
jgi:hypothetical protein